MLQVSGKHFKFIWQVLVIGMAVGGNGVNAGLCICKYLNAIAIGGGDGIGKTALEVHEHPPALEQQE